MMIWKPISSLALLALTVSASAATPETWQCKFIINSGSAKGLPNTATIHIDGTDFWWDWTRVDKRKERVVENNDIGAVAETSQAQMINMMAERVDEPPHAEPVIGATVFVLEKRTGKARMGSVMNAGVFDIQSGHCNRQPQ